MLTLIVTILQIYLILVRSTAFEHSEIEVSYKATIENVNENKPGLSDPSGYGLCMAVSSERHDFVLTSEECSTTYGLLCDNTDTDTSVISKSYEEGDAECKKQFLFIKWYGSDFCSKFGNRKTTYWTNATRDNEKVHLTKKDKWTNLDPKSCGAFVKGNLYFDICDKYRAFFCRFEVTEGLSPITTSGTIAGVLIAVTVLAIFLVLIPVVLVLKRRKLTKRRKTTIERETNPAYSYDNVRNVGYDENLLKDGIENIADDADELDQYAENSEYDKPNSKLKAKDHTCHKVYDHMITSTGSDPTYDHSSFRCPVTADVNYDTCF